MSSEYKILITGASGFLGQRLLEALSHEFECIGVSRSGIVGTVFQSYDSLSCLDFNPDIIVHCAGVISGTFEDMIKGNEVTTLQVCQFCKERKVKQVILISSISIYNRKENEYFNHYGLTKLHAENIATMYCTDEGISLAILRFSQLYDIEGRGRKNQAMLYSMIEEARDKKQILIYGKKDQMRNYLFIEDAIALITYAIKSKLSGVFDAVNPENNSLNEIAFLIFKSLNILPNISFAPNKADIKSIYIPKLSPEFNFMKFTPLSSNLKDMV